MKKTAVKKTVKSRPAKKPAARLPAAKATSKAKRKPPAPRVRMPVDDRRAQLLELGVAAFAVRPYDAVSIEEIAAQAGISRGLLFHYFPSKRDFFVASIEVMAGQLLAETFPPQPGGDPRVLLVNGLYAYFAFVERHADLFGTLLRAGGDVGAQQVVDATRREIVARIRTFLPALPPPDEALLRASLNAWERMVEGIALDWLEHRDLSRDALVQLVMRGVVIVPGAPFAS